MMSTVFMSMLGKGQVSSWGPYLAMELYHLAVSFANLAPVHIFPSTQQILAMEPSLFSKELYLVNLWSRLNQVLLSLGWNRVEDK